MEEIGLNIEVGNRLYIARKNLSLKQIDVANYLGISRASYARIERGECSASIYELLGLSDLLKVTINWITGSAEEINLSTEELFQMEKYKQFLLFLRDSK